MSEDGPNPIEDYDPPAVPGSRSPRTGYPMSDDAIKLFLAEDYILAGRKRPTRKEARASLDSLQARLTATEAEAERRRIGAKARIDDLSARLQAAEAEADHKHIAKVEDFPAYHEALATIHELQEALEQVATRPNRNDDHDIAWRALHPTQNEGSRT